MAQGEESGHRQKVLQLRIDCDADTILMRVEQSGAACHEGYASCFFRQLDAEGNVTIDEERLVDPAKVYGKSGN